jgi:DNA polymerase-4
LARAEDPRVVEASRSPKSISSELTLEIDVSAAQDISRHLRRAADTVGRRLRKQAYMARGVRMKLKRSDFRLLSRQTALGEPTQSAERLWQAAQGLLAQIDDRGPYRLIGLGAFDLVPADGETQLDLLNPTSPRSAKLEAALDAIEDRFGPGVVHRAVGTGGLHDMQSDTSLDFLRSPRRGPARH